MTMRSRLLAASVAALVAGCTAAVAVATVERRPGGQTGPASEPVAVAPVVVIEPAIGTSTSRPLRPRPTPAPQLHVQAPAAPGVAAGASQQPPAGIAAPPVAGPGAAGGSAPAAAAALPGQLQGVAALGAPLVAEAFQLAAQVNAILSALSSPLPH